MAVFQQLVDLSVVSIATWPPGILPVEPQDQGSHGSSGCPASAEGVLCRSQGDHVLGRSGPRALRGVVGLLKLGLFVCQAVGEGNCLGQLHFDAFAPTTPHGSLTRRMPRRRGKNEPGRLEDHVRKRLKFPVDSPPRSTTMIFGRTAC